jgi:hypothetical protein
MDLVIPPGINLDAERRMFPAQQHGTQFGLPCQQAKVAIYHQDLAEVNINLGLVSRMG